MNVRLEVASGGSDTCCVIAAEVTGGPLLARRLGRRLAMQRRRALPETTDLRETDEED
ncbi:MAG TPA: hypothetical protein VL693_14910 [Vicinamibacterales bacterium]|jgi:hypothetical protein|nr:hypothetical protein [Vicinamibacterales bacterium]